MVGRAHAFSASSAAIRSRAVPLPALATRACNFSIVARAPACSVAETPAMRGFGFFTRVAAVHLRQTILKLMGRQGGRA